MPFAWFDDWGVARNPDADGDRDGFSAALEYICGTDPTDGESIFRVVDTWMSNDSVFVQFEGNDSGLDEPYIMEWATNGLDGGWSVVDPQVPRAQAPTACTTWSKPAIKGEAVMFRPKAVSAP